MTRALTKIVCATLVLTAIALVAMWTGQPLLAPSLASAAFAQILTPETSSARPWGNTAGQLLGLVGGFAGVFASGGFAAPMFTGGHPLVLTRVVAVLVAVAVASALQVALRATSPAGGATAVVVAIGLETANLAGAERMIAGIVLVTVLGEAGRALVLRAT